MVVTNEVTYTDPNGSNANNDLQSNKYLSLDTVATTTGWALEGDAIIQNDPQQANFLACSTNVANIYTTYMQLGGISRQATHNTYALLSRLK